MDSHKLNSSAIASAGYDEGRSVLEVTFSSGRVYHYYAVPRSVFDELLTTESAGKYLNEVIRRKYESELVYDPHRPRVIR